MECQSSDSKKLFKVFDASKRNHMRKREGYDDNNSLATDDSTTGCQGNNGRRGSKSSLQGLSTNIADTKTEVNSAQRNRNSSSPSVSPDERAGRRSRRSSRSPRRYRRLTREGISLALKAGLVSTPRSASPRQEGDAGIESIPQDQDSFVYAFLEEAVKRDKRKQRHARRHDEKRSSRDAAASPSQEHKHRRRRHREEHSKERDKHRYVKEEPVREPAVDQIKLLETFATLCAQFKEKPPALDGVKQPACVQSHKSLQCEAVARHDLCNVDRRPERLQDRRVSRDNISPSRIRSHENFRNRDNNTLESNVHPDNRKSQCICYSYDKGIPKYESKLNMASSKVHNVDSKYQGYRRDNTPTRSCVDYPYYRPHPNDGRDYRDYDDRRAPTRDRPFEDRRAYCEQKTSRSFNIEREQYEDRARRTVRSDCNRDRYYGDPKDLRDKRYADSPREKYYYEKPTRDRKFSDKERSRRNLERFERNSVASREDDYRERFSEKERDSGLSVADGETSTISGRSNCLRVVKQEISEQREAMDKMMKLWKELMRCFKGISQTQGQERGVQETAANVQESAAAQLRLWRECMRRYETVARDVGDTDARLMEEINKQRLEMTEMANMWQECLQRYRDMSNDFNNLKHQLTMPESPSRLPPAPPVCAEGEGVPPVAPYRLPPSYPPMPPPHPAYGGGGGGGGGGSPLRQRASAPPAWWWAGPRSPRSPRSPRRRSSPESRGSRERRQRHRERDRDDTRYKEKAKPSGARSEHKHKKR